VLRAVETYGGRTIAYSLGNYLFSRGTSRTLLLKLAFRRRPEGGWQQTAEPNYLRVRGGIPYQP
jgi:poly-gamma-glutamate capsule biosynthesis protein CapA/YwtB (metallophosphatase superfamily)